jgi:hypothetical protein
MGGHPFLEIPCAICTKPVDLTGDLNADENGKAIHERCYFTRVAQRPARQAEVLAERIKHLAICRASNVSRKCAIVWHSYNGETLPGRGNEAQPTITIGASNCDQASEGSERNNSRTG